MTALTAVEVLQAIPAHLDACKPDIFAATYEEAVDSGGTSA